MEANPGLSSDAAQALIDGAEPLSPETTRRLLRYLKRANDDLVGKLRMLRSEMGRMARR